MGCLLASFGGIARWKFLATRGRPDKDAADHDSCIMPPIVQTAELNCPCFPAGGLVLHVELAKRASEEEHWERPTLCGLTFWPTVRPDFVIFVLLQGLAGASIHNGTYCQGHAEGRPAPVGYMFPGICEERDPVSKRNKNYLICVSAQLGLQHPLSIESILCRARCNRYRNGMWLYCSCSCPCCCSCYWYWHWYCY